MEKIRISDTIPTAEQIVTSEKTDTNVSERRSHFSTVKTDQPTDKTIPVFDPLTARRKIWHRMGIFKAGR